MKEEKLQERYDELDNIISTLDILIGEITDKDYIDLFNETKYTAQDELDRIEEQLAEIEKENAKSDDIDWYNTRL